MKRTEWLTVVPAAAGAALLAAAALAACRWGEGCLAEPPSAPAAAPDQAPTALPDQAPKATALPTVSKKERQSMSLTNPTRPAVEHASQNDFAGKVLQDEGTVLVDFYADWCMPCRMLAPVLDDLAREAPNVRIVKVNVDENPELAMRYRVTSIPYLVVFRAGRPVAQHLGLADKATLRALVAR